MHGIFPGKSMGGGGAGLLFHYVVSDSCDPKNCSLPGSSVHGNLQARTREWIAISCSRESSRPSNQTHACIGRWILYH